MAANDWGHGVSLNLILPYDALVTSSFLLLIAKPLLLTTLSTNEISGYGFCCFDMWLWADLPQTYVVRCEGTESFKKYFTT